jgi:hypothetical protein
MTAGYLRCDNFRCGWIGRPIEVLTARNTCWEHAPRDKP